MRAAAPRLRVGPAVQAVRVAQVIRVIQVARVAQVVRVIQVVRVVRVTQVTQAIRGLTPRTRPDLLNHLCAWGTERCVRS